MRIQVTQNNLAKALSLLSKTASSRLELPILANILIEATKDNLKLAATNLEVAISYVTKAKIDNEGSVTVPARLLSDFISQLPKDSKISISVKDNKTIIQAGGFKSTINGTSADDFPALPNIKDGEIIKLKTSDLKNALNKTMPAVSRDETRPVLGGIYMHTKDSNLYIAATDGYRLAEYKAPNVNQTISAVIPSRALQDVLKIVHDDEVGDEVELRFSDGQFGFESSSVVVVSKLIDGQYPDYQQLIPETSDISFTAKLDDLLTSAKLAGLFARETGGSVTVSVDEVEGVVVGSIASQLGENSSKIEAEISGNGSVTLNVRYLIDALICFDSEEITMRFSGTINPCILSSKSEPNYQHIVMPLRV